jgi:diguanylate cyclase (GGDEF)-like protein/PAS domain S-box-containing protein
VNGSRTDAEALQDALHALLQATPHARVTAIDARGVFVPMPPALARALPSRPALAGRSAVLLVDADDRAAVISAWEQVRATGRVHARVRLANSGAPASMFFVDLRERHGVLVGVLVASADAQTTAIAVADDAAFVARFATQRKSDTAVFVDIDDATTSMLGWSLDEMVGRASLDFVHPDDRERAVESWIDMLASPGSTRRARLRYARADGSWLWLELTNHNHLDDPAFACVVTECLDISDEMAAHEALRAREQLLRRIAETVPLGLVHLDATGEVVYANERLFEIAGSSPDDADPFRNIRHGDREMVRAALNELVGDGRDRDLRVAVLPAKVADDERICDVLLRALTDDTGAVCGAIVCVADVTDRARSEAELENRATYDSLTRCLNRTSLMAELTAYVEATQRVGVLFVDLDDFKRVNDSHGHATGDAVLVETAARIRECIRERDVVGRIGGDEFLVVCPGAGDITDMSKVAQRVVSAIAAPMELPDGRIDMTASVGVAIAYEAEHDVQALIANADAAMYVAKRRADGHPVAYDASRPSK